MSRNFAIAPSRLRNGWRGFSARLLSQRPQIWVAAWTITSIAALYEQRRSVTIDFGGPYRLVANVDPALKQPVLDLPQR